ncbi:hypothetical protein SLEP1_g57452 [Rubroshorea leprosula]|uniref:Uncharacterized protein n=1 Tax=Rubroshorea leprosula TaxID=152421 RepID=A0AAV5MPV6_9ROSI|nr:hypothetical protein SLEP1_g57452 [Rubroshorea leprosula]
MAEASQSAEIETSCDVSITIQNGRASKEQKILTVSPQLLEAMAEISQIAKTEKSCHVSILIQNDHTSIEQKLSLPWTMPEQKILRVPHQLFEFFMETLEEDSFFYFGLIRTSIEHDLVLAENQLPFFVPCKLLDIIPRTFFRRLEGSTDPKGRFISQLLKRFEQRMPGLRVDTTYDDDSMKNVKHIGDLLLSNWYPSENAIDEHRKQPKDGKWKFIRSATELREAGIDFKMVETQGNEKRCLFDSKFEKGILEMPKVTIEDDTESLYRNLIACEQFNAACPAFVTEYVALMDSLINSGKDVELLCKRGIIDNWLGDDESVAVLFNRLRDHTNIYKEQFFYARLFKNVNKHYETPWNKWKANLWHKYFNNPWAFISFLAATLLILLTVLQTIFTILPHQY